MQIPKTIHRIWLGEAQMPPEYVRFGQSWSRHHPDWEMQDWVVVVHRMTATQAAERWSDSVDLLLLDADQSPAGARAAYDAWIPQERCPESAS